MRGHRLTDASPLRAPEPDPRNPEPGSAILDTVIPAAFTCPMNPATEPRVQPRGEQQVFAEQVLRIEAEAIRNLRIGPSFHDAVDLVLSAQEGGRRGSIVVSGLGKSGLIGRKLSATFASTGTPSQFVHPTEALHGDLGRVRGDDVTILLSFGGQTDELITLASILRQDDVSIIAIVGREDCDLGRLATVVLEIGDVAEACPINLAPTASTTAMLALGDALALAVMRRREFGVDQFRKVHPGGGLGRQLMNVVSAMRFRAGVNLPLVRPHLTIEQAYAQAEQYEGASGLRRAGAVLVVDEAGRLVGIFTDGDLRRCLIQHGSDAYHQPIERFMTPRPRMLEDTALVRDAVQIVRETRFDELPVVDAEGRPLGLIDVQDLMSLKVIEG
ncbi:MAG: KpsF/GutQ family sugar-phosphate isomerase [Phycisphaeraceae bacterium]|nr:KpsF/GutQ family sugar-phosphate isomerase [Phycisphaeraceae bacterium]